MNRDYFQEALHLFNTDKPNWFGFEKFDENGNKIPTLTERQQYKYIKVIVDGATIPSEADVNAMIQTIKDEDQAKIDSKTSAQNKLKALGLTDAEIEAL